MKPKIDFITIAVRDLEKSVAFYRDGLELPTNGILKGSEDHCLFELERGFSLVLFARDNFLQFSGNPHSSEMSAGFILSYIAESKEEVNRILEQALKAGATQVGDIQNEPWGYSASFADPDGHPWEISYMPGNPVV